MKVTYRKEALALGLKRYFTGVPCLRGHTVVRKTSSGACTLCAAAAYQKYIETPAGYAKKLTATKLWKTKNRARIKVMHEKWCNDNWLKLKFLHLRAAAKQRGHEFDLEQADLVYPEYCPALGIKLSYARRGDGRLGPAPDSPSVDRIDTAKGYIKGNVVVVSQLANSIKTSATPEQIMKVAIFYTKLVQDSPL